MAKTSHAERRKKKKKKQALVRQRSISVTEPVRRSRLSPRHPRLRRYRLLKGGAAGNPPAQRLPRLPPRSALPAWRQR